MKKKLLSVFFFFLVSVLSFSAKVSDVKFSANKFIINLNAADGECLVSADEESRLIYIEIQNLDSSSFEKFSRNLCMSLGSITDYVNGSCHAILEKTLLWRGCLTWGLYMDVIS